VPRLFALCGQAQGAAATAALMAAGAEPGALPANSAWTVVLEALQDTLWRLLIDAPRSLSLPPQAAAVAPARAAVALAMATLRTRPTPPQPALAAAAKALSDIAALHVYGGDPAHWLAGSSTAAFDTWRDTAATLPARALALLAQAAPGLGRSDTALMPDLDDESWWAVVVPALQRDPLFARAPTWDERPVETGALARQRAQPLVAALIARDGHSAATRLAARLVELASLLDTLAAGTGDAAGWVRAWPLGAGVGLAAVQTARGLLLHWVRLDAGLIADYCIVAPTEWNFHPQGALFRGIVGMQASDDATLLARTRLAVHALDPCVGFEVEVVHDA